jgi:hypothetical protein
VQYARNPLTKTPAPAFGIHDTLNGNVPQETTPAAWFKLNQETCGSCRSNLCFMYIFELIFRIIVNMAKQAWQLPQTIALAFQQRQRQITRHQFETERLDRLRNPAKYAGR